MADPLSPLVTAVRRRLRLQRGLELGARAALWALGLAVPLVAALRLAGHGHTVGFAAALLLLPLSAFAWGMLRKLSPLAAAQRIDHAHHTADLVASAHGFAALGPSEQTPFMQACIAQAAALAPTLEARRAARLQVPAQWPGLAGLALLLALASGLNPPAPAPGPPEPASRIAPALATSEDLQAFEEELRQIEGDAEHDALTHQASRELRALLERLAARDVGRLDALRALQALEDRLTDPQSAGAEELRAALAQLALALGGAEVTMPLAEALREGQAEAAQGELRELAGRVRSEQLRRAERQSLIDALRRAGKAPEMSSRERAEQARRELERLLKRKPPQGRDGDPPPPASLIDRKKRELDRLEREAQQQERRRRELDRLRRELDQASSELTRQQAAAGADAMQRAAQELQRMARQQQADGRAERLSRTAAQLRELIQRGTRELHASGRTEREAAEARAEPSPAQGPPRDESAGQAPGSEPLSLSRFGQAARAGADPQAPSDPASDQADGPQSAASAATPGAPAAPHTDSPEGMLVAREATPTAGQEGTPGREPESARLAAEHADSQLTGLHGRGPSRSEVIREASAHGFASREYQKVLTDYNQHAESVLERDEVPGGYRYYVRRYFQLIRPRESAND